MLLDTFTHKGQTIEIALHDKGEEFVVVATDQAGRQVNGFSYSISKVNQIDAQTASLLNPVKDLAKLARHDVETDKWEKYLQAARMADRCRGLSGAELIREERQRQIEIKGYNDDRDDGHSTQDFVNAAASYASAANENSTIPVRWPWGPDAWKPRDQFDNLVRAGALYLAALDRAKRNDEPTDRHAQLVDYIAHQLDKLISGDAS